MLKRKEILIRCGMVGGSIVFALLLAEVGLRVLSPQKLSGSFIQPDPMLGYLYKKSVKTHFLSTLRFISMRTNAEGLRQDEEIPEKKAPGEIRILCLGDSYVFGWGVQAEENIVSRFRDKAKEQFPDANFLFMNAGHGGWGTQQMLAYLEREGFKLQPDYVLVLMGPNDVEDNDEVPLYRLLASGKLSETPEPPKYWNNRSIIQNYFPAYDWLLYNSFLVQLVRAPIRDTLNIWHRRYLRYRASHQKPQATPSSDSPPPIVAQEAEAPEEKLTRALFLRMSDEVQSYGATFTVTSVGTGTPRTLPFLQKNAPAFFHEKGIDFFDVSKEMLEKISESDMPLFLHNDPHYNAAGYQLLANLMWPHLKPRLERIRRIAQRKLASPTQTDEKEEEKEAGPEK